MLILTRRIRELLLIDDEIGVTPLGVKGNQIRFGLDAPKGVVVLREEFYDKLKKTPGALQDFIDSKGGEDPTGTLILTRRVGENFVIGRNGVFDITFTVMGVKGNQVRCGVDAPKDVNVHREEIQKRIDPDYEPHNRKAAPKPLINGNR